MRLKRAVLYAYRTALFVADIRLSSDLAYRKSFTPLPPGEGPGVRANYTPLLDP
jgi:hypothetical protein